MACHLQSCLTESSTPLFKGIPLDTNLDDILTGAPTEEEVEDIVIPSVKACSGETEYKRPEIPKIPAMESDDPYNEHIKKVSYTEFSSLKEKPNFVSLL